MAGCAGTCRYEDQWVDSLQDFETWCFNWYSREATITKGVSGPGKDALQDHADLMKVGRWVKWCAKGCVCDGEWEKATTTQITLKVGDEILGCVAMCTATLHNRAYVGKCVAPPQKKGS